MGYPQAGQTKNPFLNAAFLLKDIRRAAYLVPSSSGGGVHSSQRKGSFILLTAQISRPPQAGRLERKVRHLQRRDIYAEARVLTLHIHLWPDRSCLPE